MHRYYLNRTLCDVLEEMRTCVKTLNFAPMLSLIEEAQGMGNRMESALDDVKDYERIQEDLHDLRAEYKDLKRKVEKLKDAEDNGDTEI